VAAERADSLGVDNHKYFIRYRDFNPAYSYTYDDMMEKTALYLDITAALLEKGTLAVTSAENLDQNDICSADAVGAFTVEPLMKMGICASWQYWASSDGRVKPDVMAKGQNAR
jgi:hypothetical protein